VLGGIGVALPIPGRWLVLASLVALALTIRGARRMNGATDTRQVPPEAVAPEEA
jgi:hypothetical protein